MKIIYCSDAVIPDVPAHTVHIMKMCNAFAGLGHDVVLLAHKYKKRIIMQDEYEYYGVNKNFKIKRQQCPLIYGGALIYALSCMPYIWEKRPDLIYGRSLYICTIAAHMGRIPVVYEVHGDIQKNSKQGKWFRYLLNGKYLEKIVVITNALADYLEEEWKIDAGKIFVAPDGADKPQYNVFSKSELKNRKKGKNIGYVGHLYKGRGIDLILMLAQTLSDCYFHIIGGNELDVNYWKGKTEGIDNIFFYGHVPPSEVYNYAKDLDILMAPYQNKVLSGTSGATRDTSRWMSPLKIFEYMSYEKPIVCSDLPALREVLKDQNTCIFCDPTNVNEWNIAIRTLIDDPELALTLGRNAKDIFLNNYTWNKRAEKILTECKISNN